MDSQSTSSADSTNPSITLRYTRKLEVVNFSSGKNSSLANLDTQSQNQNFSRFWPQAWTSAKIIAGDFPEP